MEEESKTLNENVMDVEDGKGKPRERAKAGRRSESALEHRGDNDDDVSPLSPNKPGDDFELIEIGGASSK